jgi:hypothetical protein
MKIRRRTSLSHQSKPTILRCLNEASWWDTVWGSILDCRKEC